MVSELIVQGRGPGGDGIAIRGTSGSRIDGNIIFDTVNAIGLLGTTSPNLNNVIRNNEIFSNRQGIVLQGSQNSNNVVMGNNVSSNIDDGIVIGQDNPNEITDNVMLSNGRWDIRRLSGSQNQLVINNNICEVSEPFGNCPTTVPDFNIDH